MCTISRAKRLTLVLFAGFGGACTLDWVVGTTKPDAGAPDAATDVGVSDTTTDDGSGQPDGGADAPADGRVLDVNCAELVDAARVTKRKAKYCFQNVFYCTTTVIDECGCSGFVGLPDAQATTDYKNAMQTFQGSGCARPGDCTTCPILPTNGTCQVVGIETQCVP
jgi:hypothetical protein